MSNQKEIVLSLQEKEVVAGQELHGTVMINYGGRWDSIVINSQIKNSSDVFSYSLLNGKKMNYPYARLSIFKADLAGKTLIDFISSSKHIPLGDSTSVKFRVSLIQEHKEIFNDIVYIKIVKGSG